MSFEFLGVSDAILKAVSDAGYKEPTPIQRQAIPAVLQGRDILGIAQTGTGKTASFTLPLIDILAQGRARARMPRSLILEPTRELAAQVADDFDTYGRYHKLTKALIIGGVSFADQVKLLDRGVDVLIATPGRLIDQFERGKVMLTGVEILVIDEADRMLDMGFIPDVEKIRDFIPKKPQTLFFSATMPPEIKRLSDRFLVDPKSIEVAPPATAAATVDQKLVVVGARDKLKALKSILTGPGVANALIFCNRKKDVKAVYAALRRSGLNVGQLHGDMAQSERMEVLNGFKSGEITILAASDVAARGLDIDKVSHVVNYDVPEHPEDYVHRIGRTGRAGRFGTAITLATPKSSRYVEAIEALTSQPIARSSLGGIADQELEAAEESDKPRSRRGRQSGRRGRDAAPPTPAKAESPKRKDVDQKPVPKIAKQPEKRAESSVPREPAKPQNQVRKRPPLRSSSGDTWGDDIPAFLARPVVRRK